MLTLGIYFSSLCLGIVGAWAVSRFAGELGLMDCPNERSSHCSPTPRGGGIGIFAAFLLSATVSGTVTAFWLPIAAMSILALLADRIEPSPKVRLCVQLVLMAFLVVGAGRLPSDPIWALTWIAFWPVFIVGTANYFNFMDGINGIAGITGVVGFGLLALYVFSNYGKSPIHTIAVCIALACVGFLPLNMPKAKVFMGDVGSILLGAVFAGLVYLASHTFLDFVCLASFLFPFYADELSTMVVRLRDGENLTKAHRRHVYQLLANEWQIAHWRVSVGYGIMQVLVGVCVLLAKPMGVIAVLSVLSGWSVLFVAGSCYIRAVVKRT